MTNVLRAAKYRRVSTDEQALHGYSLQTQNDTLDEYCQEKGYKIVGDYVDEGISGAKPPLKRPALKQLLADVEAGKIDIIIFTKLDRWFRSIEQYYKVQEILERNNVVWQAVSEDYNTATADGRFKVNIMLSVAANERERTSERIKAVMNHKFKNKVAAWGGPRRMLGYKIEKDENGVPRLVKDPETQHIAEEFWEMMLNHSTLHQVSRHLNMTYGINRTLRGWVGTRTSTLYYGEYKGIADFCEPYITKEQWLQVNGVPQIKKSRTNEVHLFTGMLRCPVCGNRLVVNTSRNRYGTLYRSYRCANARAGVCTFKKSKNETVIETWLLDHLDEIIDKAIKESEVYKAKQKVRPKTDVDKLKEQLRKLNVIYMAGGKTDEEYLQEVTELKALIAQASVDTPQVEKDLAPLQKLLKSDYKTLYESLSRENKRKFWRDLFKEIIIDTEGNIVNGVDYISQ